MTRAIGPAEIVESDVVVIGSGIAGMTVALACGLPRIALLSKTDGLLGGSTPWAQGGIAAAVGSDDAPDLHAADTVRVGGGLVDPDAAARLAEDGKDVVNDLIAEGLAVDRRLDGAVDLSGEAAHSRRRVVHAGGDGTGRVVAEFLAAKVAADARIAVHSPAIAVELLRSDDAVAGVVAFHRDRGWVLHRAPRVVLATGGIGQLYGRTTNPAECTGDGLALALQAGARAADIEFVQFHPTALDAANADTQRPLLTEALRGDGAILRDAAGRAFMVDVHPDRELAPRDVVARAIWERIAAGNRVFLDLRALFREGGAERFPTVAGICRDAGLDPYREPIPVAPVAHYHMGGVATDSDGRTRVSGLWACGEAACTGVHGANRLASNSLLEGLVFGRRVARDLERRPVEQCFASAETPDLPVLDGARVVHLRRNLNDLVYRGAGIVRTEAGLVESLRGVAAIRAELACAPRTSAPADFAHVRATVELGNLVDVADALLVAALERCESRGAHRRADYPLTEPNGARRFFDRHAIKTAAAMWCARPESTLSKAG